jgi:hypothetical protein
MTDYSMYGSMIERDWNVKLGHLALTIDKCLINENVKVTVDCKKGLFETFSSTFKWVEEKEQEIPGIGFETRSIYKGKPENHEKNILFLGRVSGDYKGILTPIIITLENSNGETSKKEIDIFVR